MATETVPNPKDARYHAIKVTGTWQAFQQAVAADVTNSAAERKARDAKRQRETTYARGEMGGH